MISVMNILRELRETNSRLDKAAIVAKYNDHAEFREVCRLTYDNTINFGIRKIPEYDSTVAKSRIPLSEAMHWLVNSFATRQVTGNVAIDRLQLLLEMLDPDDAKVLEMIIASDLDSGINKGTVTRQWPGLIFENSVMLATAESEKALAKISYPAIVQEKADGTRINAIITDGGRISFVTRNGRDVEINDIRLREELMTIWRSYACDIVIDGELLCYEDGVMMDRQTSNGIVNKAIKGKASEEEQSFINMLVWDVIPYENVRDKQPYNIAYGFRFKELDYAVAGLDKIRLIEHKEVDNEEQAKSYAAGKLQAGYEGAVVKNIDSPWEPKRSKNLVKIKGVHEAEFRITGFKEGQGKYEGMVGSIDGESECGRVKFNAGSGLNDEMRATLDESYIGRIMTCKYFSVSRAEGREEFSLYLPIFVEVREDKDVADVLEDLHFQGE